MPKKTRSQFRSTRSRTAHSGSSAVSTLSMPTIPSYKLYQQISKCPLDRFEDCICDGNLQALIIEGNPPAEVLQQIWESLYDEFIDKMQDEEGRGLQGDVKELNILRTKINAVQTIVMFIEYLIGVKFIVNLDDLLEKLYKWTNMPITLDQRNKEQCLRTLNMLLAYTKTWYVEAEQLKLQINQSIANQENHGQMDHGYFDHMLVVLSVNNKFKVNRKETTVGEFIILVQALRKQIQEAKDFSSN